MEPIHPRRRSRRPRPDSYRREGYLRLVAILVSLGLLLFTAYLVWTHRGG